MAVFRAALLAALAANIHTCTAHMQMAWPYPLRSALNPAVPESLKDYDMASPLLLDGSNSPCKLYQDNATNPQAYDITATYAAGGTYNISLTGGATHMGGSCQISLSYDNGASFKVIESMIGGCPLSPNYDFTVPAFAPASDSALLSWSWFNLIGDQNMYQNCARVQIVGGQPAPASPLRRRTMRYESRRQTAFDALPDMFVCDVGNGCRTLERQSVVFPSPGASVLYGQDATDPYPGPGFVFANSTTSATATTATGVPTTVVPPPFPVFNTTSAVGPTGTGYSTATNYTISTISSNATSTSTTIGTTTPLDTTTSTAIATSSTSGVTSATSLVPPPTAVTVTVTFTVTPTATSATPFESVTEVITIVPISELSVLGVVPTGAV